jgi:chromate transporter
VALLSVSVTGLESLTLFAVALTVLFLSKARLVIPAVIAGAALSGLLHRYI